MFDLAACFKNRLVVAEYRTIPVNIEGLFFSFVTSQICLQLEPFRVLELSYMVAVGDFSNSLFSAVRKTSAATKHNVEYTCLFFPLLLLVKRNSAFEIYPPM